MADVMEEALRLTGLIYEAALDAVLWPPLLKSIASSVDAQGAMLRQVNSQTGRIGFFETLNYDPAFVRAYREHFHRLDYYQPSFDKAAVGELLGSEVLDRSIRSKSEYFNDYERPQEKIHCIGGVLARDSSGMIQMGFQRGNGAGYSVENRRLLQMLMPHLARAVRMQEILEAAGYRQNLAFGCLDQLRIGVLLLDSQGRIVYLNAAADELASSGVIHISAEGISLPQTEDTKRLHRLIAKATKKMIGGDECCSIGTAACHLWVTPVAHDHSPAELTAAAGGVALFVSSSGSLVLPWQRVSAHYGLTPAEARLAAALAEGEELQTIAERFSIAYSTARSQLKSIFAKTGARRQSELVAMLLQGVLAVCHTEEGA